VAGSPYVEAYINSKFLIINTDTGKLAHNSSKELFGSTIWFSSETDEYYYHIKSGADMTIALVDLKTKSKMANSCW
jgi:hypothetical protein